ncbi:hypothetical protein BSKO_09129 [Bryopsis sp. KO-2023]|nr:hypothetical protein BSKO_09129 [Bryopsis sp. KO-2023]
MGRKGKRTTKRGSGGSNTTRGSGRRLGRPPNRHSTPATQPSKQSPPGSNPDSTPQSAQQNSQLRTDAKLSPEDKVVQLLEQEREAAQQLEILEQRIYAYEESYLSSSVRGNAVRGYANWLGTGQPTPVGLREEDRIFSGSSITGNRHVHGGVSGIAEA